MLRLLAVAAVIGFLGICPAHALNKQGARQDSEEKVPIANLSGSVFFGVFLFNPTYASRPNNTGRALFRDGLHLDVDVYRRWLTVSYDLNSFTDSSEGSVDPIAPTEHDHIIGLLSTISFKHDLKLSLAVHYEFDAPGYEAKLSTRTSDYQAGFSQSYLDAYARLSWDHGRLSLFAALGGFLWNTSYAARPDNSGLALLRYVVHGEFRALSWLTMRLDVNAFTDRDSFVLTPTESDITSEIGVRYQSFEVRFLGEADLPIGNYDPKGPHPAPAASGHRQFYVATLLQWSFDVQEMMHK